MDMNRTIIKIYEDNKACMYYFLFTNNKIYMYYNNTDILYSYPSYKGLKDYYYLKDNQIIGVALCYDCSGKIRHYGEKYDLRLGN